MISFKEYLETCRFEASPEADFVREAEANSDLHGVESWSELSRRLAGRPESERRAAERVWRAYEETQA
ncbi:hypothetical protein [Roseococcus sp. YIM B11640]|uniref:hypothetical protein n=1 Tax=Roseococcus sp. YIM B11640 TaxID=3133973 RepID=UPI003C7DD637